VSEGRATSRVALRAIAAWDAMRARAFLRRTRALRAAEPVSPHLRMAELTLAPSASATIAAGFATERRRGGNVIRVEDHGRLVLGERAWLRTDYGTNYLTVFAGASLQIGSDALLNGAMLHCKTHIRIGDHARIGFGVRILDADMHDLDAETPERLAPVSIGDRVWIASHALVLRGVTIGDDVVIAAGAVVTRDLPARCLAAGAPARPVRSLASRAGCR
jgi:acetyltransferase-like isoleucine patch superfamily enzyme